MKFSGSTRDKRWRTAVLGPAHVSIVDYRGLWVDWIEEPRPSYLGVELGASLASWRTWLL